MARFGAWTETGQSLIITEAGRVDPREGVIPTSVIEAARALPAEQIERVSPLQMRDMRVGDHVLQLLAADPADWGPVYELSLVAGRWPAGDDEVVVGEGIPTVTGWGAGSAIRIFGRDFTVAGVARAPAPSYGAIWMTAAASQSLFGPSRGYQLVVIKLAPGVDAEAVRVALEGDNRVAPGFEVYHQEALMRRFAEAIRDLRAMMAAISAIALFTIGLGSFSATALSLSERGREVAIVRAVGFGPATTLSFLLVWVASQTLVAYGLGALAAALFSLWQQARAPLIILGTALPLELGLARLAAGLGLALALAAAGTALSTYAAARRPIAELLRA
jgi:putative ABC transport system permease protein